MTRSLPSIRAELPFAASGPLHRVHRSAERLLDEFVARHGYVRVDIDGTRMRTRAETHVELSRAMAFPTWYGGNWDAFNDCFGAFLHERPGELIAIVVHDAEAMDACSSFEFGVATFGVEPRVLHATPFHVFAIGDGADHGRP